MQEAEQKPKRRSKRQRRERGRLHVVPHKDSGILYISGTLRGQHVYKSTGTRDAVTAESIRVQTENEILNASVYGQKMVATFAQCVERYLREKTGGSMGKYFGKLVADIGHVKASELTNKFVHDYADREHKDVKGRTKNIYVIEPVKAVLRFCSYDDMCPRPAIKLYPNDSARVDGAPPEWITEFLARCESHKARAYVALTTTTGCRCSDAVGLKTSDISREAGTALIRDTKNGDDRVVQIVPTLMDLLFSFEHSRDGRVFGWNGAAAVNGFLRWHAKKLGLKKYSTHQIGRHAFAERMLNAGHTLAETAEMGGWKSEAVLKKHYGHLEKSRLDQAMRDKAAEVMRSTLRVVK